MNAQRAPLPISDEEAKQRELSRPSRRCSLDDFHRPSGKVQVQELNVVLKTDVQGSIEPIVNSIERLSREDRQGQRDPRRRRQHLRVGHEPGAGIGRDRSWASAFAADAARRMAEYGRDGDPDLRDHLSTRGRRGEGAQGYAGAHLCAGADRRSRSAPDLRHLEPWQDRRMLRHPRWLVAMPRSASCATNRSFTMVRSTLSNASPRMFAKSDRTSSAAFRSRDSTICRLATGSSST